MLTALRTPEEDGQTLQLPATADLPKLLDQARRAFAGMDFSVVGLPAAEVRRMAREELAGMAAVGPERTWVVTGHQAEMHHAGVWFKDAVAAALAEAAAGSAIHLVADLDVAKNAAAALPARGPDGRLRVVRTPLAEAEAGACPAQLPPPGPQALDRLVRAAGEMPCERGLFDTWAAGVRDARAATLAEWFAAGRSAVATELGLAVRDAFFSRIVTGRAYACFAADLLLGAERMHRLHEKVRSAFRRRHRLRNPAQPVPALRRHGEFVETPLWAYRPSGPREALFARADGGRVRRRTPAANLAELPADPCEAAEAVAALTARGVWLAPRALTFTMFARGFLADVFIHGLGGARYDALGDELTAGWFGWRPPPFVTATATVRLDLPRRDASADDLARARWHEHHAWHNPQQYAATPLDECAQSLADRKAEILRQLAEMPRRSSRRTALFAELTRCNANLREQLAEAVQAAQRRREAVQADLAENAVADDREYPFAVAPRPKLGALFDRARAWASAAQPCQVREEEPPA